MEEKILNSIFEEWDKEDEQNYIVIVELIRELSKELNLPFDIVSQAIIIMLNTDDNERMDNIVDQFHICYESVAQDEFELNIDDFQNDEALMNGAI